MPIYRAKGIIDGKSAELVRKDDTWFQSLDGQKDVSTTVRDQELGMLFSFRQSNTQLDSTERFQRLWMEHGCVERCGISVIKIVFGAKRAISFLNY